MNQPNRLVKALVLASSITLAGGFVLYRAGALDTLLDTRGVGSPAFVDDAYAAGARTMPDTPYSNPSRSGPTDENGTSDSNPRRRTLLPGSKSGVFVEREAPDTVERRDLIVDSSDEHRREVFMGGSKSLAPLVTPRETDSTREERRVFMGGSKSLAPLIEPSAGDSAGVKSEQSTKKSKR